MSSWERLVDLVCQLERALYDLQSDRSCPKWEALRDEEAGWYTRGYLVHRLPAEIARSQKSGRPCGLALLRLGEGERMAAALWRPFLAVHLDPEEVAIAYGERELCFLFPERDHASTRTRIGEMAEAASLAGIVSFSTARASFLSYPETLLSPAALLAQLEEEAMPLAEVISMGKPGMREPDALNGQVPVGDGDSAAGPAEPVAVGFASDRTMPVSFWFRRELYAIHAVLDAEEGLDQGQRLTVLTGRGRFSLERAGQRWYAQKLE